jgi:hypothetical protein
MSACRSRKLWFVLVSAIGLAGAAPREAEHASPRIIVGEVTARMAGGDPGTESLLRRLVSEEISRLRLSGEGARGAYVLSASLVHLDVRRLDDGAQASSVVSMALRREGSGGILAFLQGRGRAEAGRDEVASARASAMAAAVRGAVRRVPEAL